MEFTIEKETTPVLMLAQWEGPVVHEPEGPAPDPDGSGSEPPESTEAVGED